MSDQWRSGAIISLEEVFRSSEFGRRPVRRVGAPVMTVDAADPPYLEEVFLSVWFGHPEALRGHTVSPETPTGPSSGHPNLVLLPGAGYPERDFARYRGAIGAVSGVAAAALAVAGMSSTTGSPSHQPTISAEGPHSGHGSAPTGGVPLPGGGGTATPPAPSGPTPVAPGSTAGPPPLARFTAATPTPGAIVVATPPPAPVTVVPSPPPGGGTPPPAPAPGGQGNVLTPVLVTAGTTVAAVGSTVTAASNDLAHAVPAASPVTGLLSNLGTTVTALGDSVAGA